MLGLKTPRPSPPRKNLRRSHSQMVIRLVGNRPVPSQHLKTAQDEHDAVTVMVRAVGAVDAARSQLDHAAEGETADDERGVALHAGSHGEEVGELFGGFSGFGVVDVPGEGGGEAGGGCWAHYGCWGCFWLWLCFCSWVCICD